jgi:simple sugar transport system ATP-binding protein
MNAVPAPSTLEGRTAVLEARGVTKDYGAVCALDAVSLALHAGEIVGLVGDNGAGKSTLTGILSGAIPPSAGEIYVEGRSRAFHTPHEAREAGVETVFQDLALAPDLSISDNLFIGRELLAPSLSWCGWLDRRDMERRCEAELARLSIRVRSVRARCRALSGGQRQAIAIARGVIWSSKALLLDEPTAALGVEQQAQVGQLIREVAGRGVAIMLISHNLPQVLELCDRIAVLWRGRLVANLAREECDLDSVVQWITGAALKKAAS